jgi:purine-binding chemotaxis protein CheW
VSTATANQPTASNELAACGGKFLAFALGREEYGLEILKVREIVGNMDVTAVPRTPAYVKGVMNLRGQVISVMDLRARFGMPAIERTEQTCIIVVEIRHLGRIVNTGLLVDRVLEVLDIDSQDIEPAPSFGGDVTTDFILGMGKVNGAVKILLDIDKVLAAAEISNLSRLHQQQLLS